ncbi:alginate export family protein [Allosphingosinicella deserti]|uniref:Alginate export family protein n=1 Tax=Allosphingosinicella deserti TaxID=2116704 RepID=A0A2P7QGJ3_9SPHN|nr:alginate export family protein [Sphingomonas deserti]PSJ37101.1 alginate export family protein [Sphingomonas deserti]
MITARFCIAASGAALLLGQPLAANAGPLQDAIGAGDAWKIRGSFRSRTEVIDGQFRPNVAENDFFQSFRSTLFAEYDAGPVRFGAEVIDARGYGQADNSSVGTAEINPLELGQAYVAVEFDDRLGQGSKGLVTAGRYTLAIGSKRLLDSYGAGNRVPTYTGINVDWKSAGGDRLIAFWSMPDLREPTTLHDIRHNRVKWDPETMDLQFFGASFTKANVLGGSVEFYGYRLWETDSEKRPTIDRHLFTPGMRFSRAPKTSTIDWDLEGAYQLGEVHATKSPTDIRFLDVSAWFVHAELGKSFAGAWSPRVSVHYDQASGDTANPNTYTRFDPLFGSRRTDFGPVGLYGPVNRANLISGGVRVEAAPTKRLDLGLMTRGLWLDSSTDSFGVTGVRDRTGNTGTYAGTQAEARVRYWLKPKVIRLDTAVAYLAKGKFLRDAPNAPDTGDTVYAGFDLTVDF